MCTLCPMLSGQAEIRDAAFVDNDRIGNLSSFLAIFPDQMAPVSSGTVRKGRELVLMRWGMPSPHSR